MSDFFVGAYWPSRKESIEKCAERLRNLFVALTASDQAFATWFEAGRSRKQALEKRAHIEDQAYLLSLLSRGRNRRDVGRTIIEELGFGVGLWNGGGGERVAELSIKCGLYWTSPSSNASLSNYVTLDLPQNLGELKQIGRMSALLAAVARIWEPDWAAVISRKAMNTRAFDVKIPFVDWMVYVARRIDDVLPPSSVVQLENGSLIVVQPDPPTVNNAADQENIRRIENLLRR